MRHEANGVFWASVNVPRPIPTLYLSIFIWFYPVSCPLAPCLLVPPGLLPSFPNSETADSFHVCLVSVSLGEKLCPCPNCVLSALLTGSLCLWALPSSPRRHLSCEGAISNPSCRQQLRKDCPQPLLVLLIASLNIRAGKEGAVGKATGTGEGLCGAGPQHSLHRRCQGSEPQSRCICRFLS